ncbi:MAG: hypothetical protein WC291_05985 [Thermodesulfovibrionales bacterium]
MVEERHDEGAEETAKKPEKKGKSKKFLIIIAALVVLGGAGGFAGYKLLSGKGKDASGSMICRLGIPIETHLVMSASSDDEFLAAAYRQYRNLPIDCIAFTKSDEAVKFGSTYNHANLYCKPVAYITTCQNVPADISFPDSEALTEMILKSEVAA